jgi:hypothetical protein
VVLVDHALQDSAAVDGSVAPGNDRGVWGDFIGTAATSTMSVGRIVVVPVRTPGFLIVRRVLGLVWLGPAPATRTWRSLCGATKVLVLRRRSSGGCDSIQMAFHHCAAEGTIPPWR